MCVCVCVCVCVFCGRSFYLRLYSELRFLSELTNTISSVDFKNSSVFSACLSSPTGGLNLAIQIYLNHPVKNESFSTRQ